MNNPQYSPIIRKRENSGNKINNVTRVKRTLKLIALLQDWKTNAEIKTELQIHERTVHRYLNMLVDFGFIVEWSWLKNGFFIYRITNTKEVLGMTE